MRPIRNVRGPHLFSPFPHQSTTDRQAHNAPTRARRELGRDHDAPHTRGSQRSPVYPLLYIQPRSLLNRCTYSSLAINIEVNA